MRARGYGVPVRRARLAACALALGAACGDGLRADVPARPAAGGAALSVRWRAQMQARPNLPCRVASGWVVTDAAGAVTALSEEGGCVWRAAFSNQTFACAASVASGRVVVASEQGRVVALSEAKGEVLWARETDGRFQHAPLLGVRAGEAVVWEVSQEDGRLFCLRASDGGVVWRSEPTNRCDGEPVLWRGRIAYGNCDGAVYVFDAESGRRLGSVEVGSEDQMAGGLLATSDGRLAAGTRQGRLAVVRAERLTREALVKVSESEAFVRPVEAFGGAIAIGTQEGEVAFWAQGEGVDRRFAVGVAVDGLLFAEGRLYVLAGGGLSVFDARGRLTQRLALGDDVSGPVAGGPGLLACVADGAVVCVKGGGE